MLRLHASLGQWTWIGLSSNNQNASLPKGYPVWVQDGGMDVDVL